MQTVVPIGTFEAKAREILGETGYDALLAYLANNPKSGVLIKRTGGLRKLRIRRKHIGKSGGARVIYYYHSENKPVLPLLIYAKTDQEDLTSAQEKALKSIVDDLKKNIDRFR